MQKYPTVLMKTIFASVNVLRLLTVSALLNDTTCCGLTIGISFGWKLLTQAMSTFQ